MRMKESKDVQAAGAAALGQDDVVGQWFFFEAPDEVYCVAWAPNANAAIEHLDCDFAPDAN